MQYSLSYFVSRLRDAANDLANTLNDTQSDTTNISSYTQQLIDVLRNREDQLKITQYYARKYRSTCHNSLLAFQEANLLSGDILLATNPIDDYNEDLSGELTQAMAPIKTTLENSAWNCNGDLDLTMDLAQECVKIARSSQVETFSFIAVQLYMATSIIDPIHDRCISSLASIITFRARFHQKFDASAYQIISKAFDGIEEAVSDPIWREVAEGIAAAKTTRFELELEDSDIDSAISILEQLILDGPGELTIAGLTLYLIDAHRIRFRLRENGKDLLKAKGLLQELKYRLLSHFCYHSMTIPKAEGLLLLTEYNFMEREELIPPMISSFSDALVLSMKPRSNPHELPLFLSHLANSVSLRYAKNGDGNDRSLAILGTQEALQCFPLLNDATNSRRNITLQNLGDVLLRAH